MTEIQIAVDELSFAYGPGITALDRISFTIGPGERVGLIGHNGSGKSTLARHLNGLLRPCSGTVRIQGTATASKTVAAMARKVALMFQNPDNQICSQTVAKEVAFGPRHLGYPWDRIARLVEEALDLFDLTAVKGANPLDLGYSLKKRVALASVLAMDTQVLVLDEPTAGLDAGEIRLVTRALERVKDQGKTVVIITHDMDFLAETIPRILCLSQGKLVYDGRPQPLFNQPGLLEKSGLMPPQVARLSAGLGLAEPATTPQGVVRRLKDLGKARALGFTGRDCPGHPVRRCDRGP